MTTIIRLLLAAAAYILLVVALITIGRQPHNDRIADCRHHGGLQQLTVQSVNVDIIACRDGTIYRYDTH